MMTDNKRTKLQRRSLCLIASVSCLALLVGICNRGHAQPAPNAPSPIPSEVRQNPNAPNILIVLNDDVGFGASSTFGGPIPTPTYEALAAGGLRYNEFHTTAMCSPTRAALLTGRNAHRVNMGTITNLAINEPGYTGVIPKTAATIGRVLQLNGYNTAWFGKSHITPEWEETPIGPFDRWPTGLGFDYFYGFLAGATDQWNPNLVENTRPVDHPDTPGYILDNDLADHVISWVQQHNAIAPDKPFLVYLATGTGHEPQQAPADWIARFHGKFDQGWDKVREETFARQQQAGIIPPNAVLTPRPDVLPAWNSLSKPEQEVAARMMEVHAAQRAHFDDQFGRIVAALKRTGKWDNTLVIYIDGDNGASAEAGPRGTVLGLLNGANEPIEYMHDKLDQLGGPRSAENYPAGWAWAMDTPFQYFKQVASHLGGIRDGMVISWPKRIGHPGGLRSQFSHVTDIAPTIFEAAGIKPPTMVDGVPQMSLDGTSLLYTLDDPKAPTRHTNQYFEMLGNRSFYKDGWLASTTPPRMSWERKPVLPVKDWKWELYDLDGDYSQAHDVAAANPDKLTALRADFDQATQDNNFKVLDFSLASRVDDRLRPYWPNGRTHFEFFPMATRLPDEAFPNIRNRAWSLSAPVTVSSDKANGTIITQGGWPNGWGLFLFDGRPTFIYTYEPVPVAKLSAPQPLPRGRHVIDVQVVPDGDALGGPATVSLSVDHQPAVTQHLTRTVPFFFGAQGVGIGRAAGNTLVDDYKLPFKFEGEIDGVTIDLQDPQKSAVLATTRKFD